MLNALYTNAILHKYRKKIRKLSTKLCENIAKLEIDKSVKLHDEQLMAIQALLDGYLVELKTGEGKTYVNAILVSMIASKNLNKAPSVFVITTNDYLAKRDCKNLENFLKECGFTSAYNRSGNNCTEDDKNLIFQSDIVFSSATELCYDYLKNRSTYSNYWNLDMQNVIIDELDYVMIDNATTDCVISESLDGNADISTYFYLNMFSSFIEELDYTELDSYSNRAYDYWDVDYVNFPSTKQVSITEKGVNHIKELVGLDLDVQPELYHLLSTMLAVYRNYKRGVDYDIESNQICTINQSNGRLQPNGKFSIEIQNCVESLHGIPLTTRSNNEDKVSYQLFFTLFKAVYGLSGTLRDVSGELETVLGKSVLSIPTHNEIKRIDYPTIYTETKQDKLIKLVDDLHAEMETHNPIVIVFENELELYTYKDTIENEVTDYHIKVLVNDSKEEEIIVENAGKSCTLTLSTSIIGRGTDIKVDEGHSLTLFSFCHFSNSRIDEQVRGRSGRQGQFGKTKFYCSLEDYVWKALTEKELIKLEKSTELNTLRKRAQAVNTSREQSSRKSQYVISKVDLELFTMWMHIFSSDDVLHEVLKLDISNPRICIPKWLSYYKLGYYEISLNNSYTDMADLSSEFNTLRLTLSNIAKCINGDTDKREIEYKELAYTCVIEALLSKIEHNIIITKTDEYILEFGEEKDSKNEE